MMHDKLSPQPAARRGIRRTAVILGIAAAAFYILSLIQVWTMK
jgi:hypothetical protein